MSRLGYVLQMGAFEHHTILDTSGQEPREVDGRIDAYGCECDTPVNPRRKLTFI
jgi:hypothetical protein